MAGQPHPACAAALLRVPAWAKGVPIEIIALILGHEDIATTYAFYLHADMRAAERAISLVAPPKTKPGRYRAPDPLLAFLEGL